MVERIRPTNTQDRNRRPSKWNDPSERRWMLFFLIVGGLLVGGWLLDAYFSDTGSSSSSSVDTTTRRTTTTVRRTTTTVARTTEAECGRMAGGLSDDVGNFADAAAEMALYAELGEMSLVASTYGWADSYLFILEVNFEEFRDECGTRFPTETREAQGYLDEMRSNWRDLQRYCRAELEPLGLMDC